MINCRLGRTSSLVVSKILKDAMTLLCLIEIVLASGGFAPLNDNESPSPTMPPLSSSSDIDPQPTFLGRHNATVSVHAGDTATLDCHVLRLAEKTVSWTHRRGGDFHILTIGFQTYHNDNRYILSFESPTNWKLQIRYAQKKDEGLYECQVSTHPPVIKRVFLSVTVPDIEIRDPRGTLVSDAYHRVDSTIGLQCVVLPAPITRLVEWTKDGHPVNTMKEKGIRVDVSSLGVGISSWLHIARAAKSDSGNYTCAAGDAVSRSVTVHVLDGETSAAMQHSTDTNGGNPTSSDISPFFYSLCVFLLSLF